MATDLIKKMKKRIEASGSNKKEVLYFKADTKRRVRFLQELDTGEEFKFHSLYRQAGNSINALCQEEIGKDCPYCGNDMEGLREVTNYAWSVFDYDSNETKILLTKAEGISPVPLLIELYQEYGTIMDRDYTIKKIGSGQSGKFSVVPGERTTFRNKKAKVYKKAELLKILGEGFKPNSDDTDDDEDYEEKSSKKKSSGKKSSSSGKSSSKTKTTKKKEKSLREKMEDDLDLEGLKEIALEIGLSKKEIKGLDEEELLDLLFEDYEEDDIKEEYESYLESYEDEEEEDEDEDDEDDDDDDEE